MSRQAGFLYSLIWTVVVLTGCSSEGILDQRPDAIPSIKLGGTLAGGTVSESDWQTMLDRVSSSVFKVVTFDCDGELIGSGSGFRVADKIVTNRHVVEGAQRVDVESSLGSRFEVANWRVATVDDLALLELNRSPLSESSLVLAPNDPIPGDLLASIGYPLGGELTLRRARVLAIVRDEIDSSGAYLIESNARVLPGDSGGVLVNSDGQVSAVTTALSFAEDTSLSVPVSRLKTLLTSRELARFPRTCN